MVDSITMKRIIITAVFEFLADAAADFNSQFRGYGNISPIKQPMDVGTQ